MLRRVSCKLSAIAFGSRSANPRLIRLASFKTQPSQAKDAPPPIKTYQTTKSTSSTPSSSRYSEGFNQNYYGYYAHTMSLIKWAAVAVLSFHIVVEYFYVWSGAYGVSMMPGINSEGDWLWISNYYRRGRGIEVGDIVSFQHPVREGDYAVKRVMGLEGDFVLMNTPGKSDAMIQVPEGHCWVVGDNLPHSRDSRMFGPLPMALIAGKVIARYGKWSGIGLPRFSRLDRGLQDSDESDTAID